MTILFQMGRTKRKRCNKHDVSSIYEYDKHIIKLQKWMSDKGWKNHTKLNIKFFQETGRGISSKKKINKNDIIIAIPLEVMITYNTLTAELKVKEKLKIHEYLAFFLVIEKLKGSRSKWIGYINSLPEIAPPLPWLGTPKEIELYPLDLRTIVEKTTEDFKIFLNKIKKHIPKTWLSIENLLIWAYTMVNTRAVYIDPDKLCNESLVNLTDKPSMALCPLLDMFNHHYLAKTEACIISEDQNFFYQLQTLTAYKKYDQIFISYGCHDNLKLLTEYGFFIPNNHHDIIRFTLDEVLQILKFRLDQTKYRFIKEHNMYNDLYVGFDGVSYNLQAVIFVGYFVDNKCLSSIIFGSKYPKSFLEESLPFFVRTLLKFKEDITNIDLTHLESDVIVSESGKTVREFVKNRITFIHDLQRMFK